jgi:2-oxoglutarate dehydrogenase E2 component (dihydrolipoamide succinyltransferase)
MQQEIIVPRMGESISEAVVGTIFKPTGSSVKADDEVLELETDKVNQVLYAPGSGTVTLTVKAQETVKIGQVIGFVETDGAAKPPAPQEVKAPQVAKGKAAFLQEIEKKPVIQVKPIVRNSESGDRETRVKLPKIRKVIAERLVQAQHQAAMLTTFNEVDLTQVILLRERYKELFLKEHQVKLGYMPFFIKAAVSALKEFPVVNAYLDGEDLVYRNYFDVSVAVSSDRGLVVPVLRDVDQLSFAEIEKSMDALSAKARDGTITMDELTGGGFTITNGGVFGSLLSTPILNPPQVAILGMHKIVKRPVAINDQVLIRPMMYVALTYDHRVLDGREAVSFLVHIKQCLEDPARLLMEV